MPIHALISAADQNDVPKMKELLASGSIKDVNEQPLGATTTRWSALHFAAYNGSVEATELLLEHGADRFLNCRDDAKPLETAMARNNYEVQQVLWKKMRELKVGQRGAWGGAGVPLPGEEAAEDDNE